MLTRFRTCSYYEAYDFYDAPHMCLSKGECIDPGLLCSCGGANPSESTFISKKMKMKMKVRKKTKTKKQKRMKMNMKKIKMKKHMRKEMKKEKKKRKKKKKTK
jgi:hypothetical protein